MDGAFKTTPEENARDKLVFVSQNDNFQLRFFHKK